MDTSPSWLSPSSPCHPKLLLHLFLQEAQTGANEVSESQVGSCWRRLGSGKRSHFIRPFKWKDVHCSGCDLPISWAFPTVSGLAGDEVVRPAALLPAKDTRPAPGFLSSSLCPGLAFQGTAKTPLPKIFLRKGQVTSSHLCQYLCFLLSPSVFSFEQSIRVNVPRVGPGGHFGSLEWSSRTQRIPWPVRVMMFLVEFYLKLWEVW